MRTTSAGRDGPSGAAASLAFLAWMLTGAAAATGVLAILSIGIFLLLAAALFALALALSSRTRNRTAAGLLSGAGLAPLYVAFLNRDGPGTICVTTGTSQTCGEEWSPWPWLVAGLTLILAGLALYALLARRAS